jgi:hypothetical protein
VPLQLIESFSCGYRCGSAGGTWRWQPGS